MPTDCNQTNKSYELLLFYFVIQVYPNSKCDLKPSCMLKPVGFIQWNLSERSRQQTPKSRMIDKELK